MILRYHARRFCTGGGDRSDIVMMKVVRFKHVEVVLLLEADGDGVVMMLDQSMSQKFEVLMDPKLAHMLELKDVIDLPDETLA